MKGSQFGLRTALVLFSSLVAISSQSPDVPLDACGKAAVVWNDISDLPTPYMDAQTAYDCLIAIPFHQDDALATLGQLRLFLQFYSAQTYFAHPPTPELELNPVDLNKTLDTIESNINFGNYSNHYSFNRDLFNLFGDYRDGHVTYYPSCYVPFAFVHNYALLSVAKTPDSIPDIHAIKNIPGGFEAGPKVVKINGQNSVDYLTRMANTHPELTWVDPDARFNQLLVHSSGGTYQNGVFAERLTYDDEDLILTWENGTTTKVEWFSRFLPAIAGVIDSFDSAETFYDNVCVRSQEDIAEVLEVPSTSSKKMRGKTEPAQGYPHQIFRRTNDTSAHYGNATSLTPVFCLDGGELALYIMGDVGVFVANAFAPADDTDNSFMSNFATLITDSISYLKKNKITKLIIDVSGNGGGFVSLGENFAMQLFPTADHFFGSNMRWNPALAAMLTLGADPNDTYWDLGQYHKMDGSDFSSYEEFLGPVYKDQDYFTLIARPDIVEANVESGGELPGSYPGPQPFETHNIVLVSSGMCGSTCAVFSEALAEQGVQSIAFGGRPRKGPMQTVGGIKGSQVLKFDEISNWAYRFLGEEPDIYNLDYIPGVLIAATLSSTINFRNSWRKVDQDTPIEFIYTPSDYKLSYTNEMMKNQTLIWATARDVFWRGAKYLYGGDGGYNSSVVGSAADEDDASALHGSAIDGSGSSSSDNNGGVAWSSLGQLIWSKINGHGMDFDF